MRIELITLPQLGNNLFSEVGEKRGQGGPWKGPNKQLGLFFLTYLESESLVEDGVESFLVNLCVKLLLLVREHKDLDVRVGRAAAVHGEKVGRLQDPNSELRRNNTDKVPVNKRQKKNKKTLSVIFEKDMDFFFS